MISYKRDNVVIPELMRGKTCVVTGANSGLGYESTYALAEMGADVLMLVRSAERGKFAMGKIQNEIKNASLTLITADLSSLDSVQQAINSILNKVSQIDVLINNAATVSSSRELSNEGFELTLAVNHLAHFYLTLRLLKALNRSRESRIVNVASINHFKTKLDLKNIQLEKNYQILKAYNRSKLANVLFTYELDRKLNEENLTQISVNCADPGHNDTPIGEKNTNWLHGFIWNLKKRTGTPPALGALNQIYLATSPDVSGISGKYWSQFKQVKSSKDSYDKLLAQNLWNMSNEMCGFTSDSRVKDYL
jgi:retinol dehydrogenase 12